jgi:cytochrome b
MSTHTTSVRVWDLPTRLFHSALALLVLAMFVTAELFDSAMDIHFFCGYAILALLFFRLIWGIVGGYWSRFVNFVPNVASLRAYVTAMRHGQGMHAVGHNPLGALSVLALLLVLFLQVFSGFLSDDEASNAGPWVDLVSSHWVELATNYHAEIGKVILIALIALHLASIAYYLRIKKENLVQPMIDGDKNLPSTTQSSHDSLFSRLFALAIFVACAFGVYQLVQLGQ